MNRARTLTPAERRTLGLQLAKQYAAGASIPNLAATHHRSYGSVRDLLLLVGTELRRPGGQIDHLPTRKKKGVTT